MSASSDTSAPQRLAPSVRLRVTSGLEAFCAFLVGGLFYVGLYGELPYHDVARFASQVESGVYVWDIGHFFLQPATLLWHKYLGFGESAQDSQKHINTFATAAGIGVFYALTQFMGIVRWQRIAATILLMGSTSLIILAPSGHMKLLAFPFVNAALYFAVAWERGRAEDGLPHWRELLLAAAFLAIAAAFLASCLATAPFATMAVLFASLRHGDGWRASFLRATVFAGACGMLFVLLACFGLAVFAGQPVGIEGLRASISHKNSLLSQSPSLSMRLARAVFGSVNNIVGAPDIGSIGRAWLHGEIPSLPPYLPRLLPQLLPWFAMLVLLAVIYLRAAIRAVTGPISLMLVAFLLGAQSWTLYWSLNDPEHWFQLTVPTLLLFLTLFSSATIRLVLPIWAGVTLAFNLWVTALPQATYPLSRYQGELQSQYTDRDLLVYFAAYPGGPNLGFFDLGQIPGLKLDLLFADSGNAEQFFGEADRQIAEARLRGGRVIVFGVFDPENTDAPWPTLTPMGMSKTRLFGYFRQHYTIRPLGSIAEMPAWEILPPGS